MNQENKNSVNVVQMVLIGLLIGAAFFIGMLWTKVQSLESTGGPSFGAKDGAAAPTPTPAAPQIGSADNLEPVTKDDWVKGNRNARYALVEYSDIDCPFCKRFHPTAQKLIDDNKDTFMWVFRHFPLDTLHPNARRKAEAAECVGKLGGNDKFWSFLDNAVDQGGAIGLDKMPELAVAAGVSQSAFKSCFDKNETKDLVAKDFESGSKAGIQGTPGNILLDTQTGKTVVIPGAVPYENLGPYLDKLKESTN